MPDNPFFRDASERLTFELWTIPIETVPSLCAILVKEFQLSEDGPWVSNGVDLLFWCFHRGPNVIEFAWDVWSGFIVTAKSVDSEPLVREIGAWLLQNDWALTAP